MSSRTLGFIAGLTVPAGLYYVSVLHLQGTAAHVSEALHEQSVRLENPTKLQPAIFEPRRHDSLVARVRQGWNEGIESSVRFVQETDWQEAARKAGSAVVNLSKTGWARLQPAIEEGQEKLHEVAEATKDTAYHAGESVGRVIHDVNDKTHELAHEANIKGHQLAHDAEAEARRLAEATRSEYKEAKGYLKQAQLKADQEYELLKANSARKGRELKDETIRQAHEAESVLSRLGAAAAAKTTEKSQALKDETLRQAREARDVLTEASSTVAANSAQTGRDVRDEVTRQAHEAKEALSQAGSTAAAKSAQTGRTLRKETIRQAHEAESFLSESASVIRDEIESLRDASKRAARDAKTHVSEKTEEATKKAESSLLSAQMRASEAWILAEDRYQRLLEATEHKADMKHKELLEQFGGRRIGFSSVNDPTGAEKQVRAAEAYNKKPEVVEVIVT